MKPFLHALIVDDVPSDIRLFEIELEKVIGDFPFFIQLTQAHSCAEAIDIIGKSPKFDFAILDYQLDGMNVFQLLQKTGTHKLGVPVLTTPDKELPLGKIYSIKPTPIYLPKIYDSSKIRPFLKELWQKLRNINDEREEEFIVIHQSLRERVKYRNIYFFESVKKKGFGVSRNHSKIYYKSDTGEIVSKIISGNLNTIHKELRGSLFIRAGRSSLVNVDNISRCNQMEQLVSFFTNSREEISAIYSPKYSEFTTLMFEMRLMR